MTELALAFLHGGKQGSWIWDEVRAVITRVDAGRQLLQTRPQAVAEMLLAEMKNTV